MPFAGIVKGLSRAEYNLNTARASGLAKRQSNTVLSKEEELFKRVIFLKLMYKKSHLYRQLFIFEGNILFS
jgi:hypothetical protein